MFPFGIILITLVFALALASAFLCAISAPTGAADAEDGDTFSVVFPTVSYFQSNEPTLVSANNDYLIIYDESVSSLFVRKNGFAGTYTYPIDIDNAEFVKAVGHTAFIYADGNCYTVDLSDSQAKPVKRDLPTPQNANYFRSDGTYLYAKSSSGYITIYDENLEVAFGIDDYVYLDGKINVFAGMDPLAGENGLIYYFPSIFGNPFYVVYDPVNGERKVNTLMNCFITEAYVGDIIYAQVSSVAGIEETGGDNPLIGMDKETGKVLFTSEIIPDSFCATGDKLFTIEGKQIVTYTLEKSEEGEYIGFKKLSTISMAGSDAHHLDRPNDVTVFDGRTAVADGANKRIGLIDSAGVMTDIQLDFEPLRITNDSSGLYALSSDGRIVKVEGSEITRTYTAEGAVDIAYLDKLYLLKPDGLYTALGGGVYKLADIDGGKRISCAKDGTNVYILTDNSIEVFTRDGKRLTQFNDDFAEAVDVAIDYAGQIIILYPDRVENYTNNAGVLTLLNQTVFRCATANAHANSFYLNGKHILFTADECLIGKSSVDAVTKDTFESHPFIPTQNEVYSFAKRKTDTDSYIIPSDGRMEAIKEAPSETVILFDNVECISENHAYALLNGEFFIIQKNDFDEVQTETLTGEYAAITDTSLYTLPEVNTGRTSIAAGARFNRISDCADYDGGQWIRVEYGEKIYFVKAADCEEYIYVIPEEEKVYGKAKAGRVGGLVDVFAEADEGSEVITQIVDGTQVEIVDETENFYMVRIGDDKFGYMRKSEVEFGGLTTVQIVAIVLAVFVVLSGICVFAAIQLTKKKAAESAKKKDR